MVEKTTKQPAPTTKKGILNINLLLKYWNINLIQKIQNCLKNVTKNVISVTEFVTYIKDRDLTNHHFSTGINSTTRRRSEEDEESWSGEEGELEEEESKEEEEEEEREKNEETNCVSRDINGRPTKPNKSDNSTANHTWIINFVTKCTKLSYKD